MRSTVTHLPLCRRYHRMKQREGWILTQPRPGIMIWQAPADAATAPPPPGKPARLAPDAGQRTGQPVQPGQDALGGPVVYLDQDALDLQGNRPLRRFLETDGSMAGEQGGGPDRGRITAAFPRTPGGARRATPPRSAPAAGHPPGASPQPSERS